MVGLTDFSVEVTLLHGGVLPAVVVKAKSPKEALGVRLSTLKPLHKHYAIQVCVIEEQDKAVVVTTFVRDSPTDAWVEA